VGDPTPFAGPDDGGDIEESCSLTTRSLDCLAPGPRSAATCPWAGRLQRSPLREAFGRRQTASANHRFFAEPQIH